jgi:light-regulated signal transduction histidine kinase (bacteriophytochrome)
MLAAALVRFPALRDLRVQFAALACVTALPFVAGAIYDIWFAMQTASGTILTGAHADVIEVRIGGLAIALIVSGLLAAMILYRMMPVRVAAAEGAAPRDLRALNSLLERRVETRTRELERSIRELESYSYVISHNLRGPLRAIDACATLIDRHHHASLDPEGAALFARLRGNALRMAQLLDALIEYSKLGRRRLVRQTVDMTEVVKATVEDMRLSEADRERIAISALPAVPADSMLMQLAWRELIDNALKFSARAAERRVRIEGEVRHGMAEFRVSDGGAGFDPAYADKLFALFERLHGEDEFPGAGTGLAVVKRVIERHGGFVWADGTPGRGASFGFGLPLGAAREAPALDVATAAN